MKTQVIMERELLGQIVRQQSKSEFLSATDLVSAGNIWRGLNSLKPFNMTHWLGGKGTLEFIKELEYKYGKVVKKSGKGRNACTWLHPLLFIDMALAVNPKLKIEVYEWLFDALLKYRNDSGDSYRLMCGALYSRYNNYKEFPKFIEEMAVYIRGKCRVVDWEKAGSEKLILRDKIHRSVATLCTVITDPHRAVTLGVSEHIPSK